MNRRHAATSFLPLQEIQMKSKSLFPLATLPVLLLAGLVLLPASLRAQDAAVAQSPVPVSAPALAVETTLAAPVVPAGPRHAPVGVTRITADVAPSPYMAPSKRNTSWMIVGGAMLLVGVVIGGDAGTIVALTGGTIGLVGLFRYLQ